MSIRNASEFRRLVSGNEAVWTDTSRFPSRPCLCRDSNYGYCSNRRSITRSLEAFETWFHLTLLVSKQAVESREPERSCLSVILLGTPPHVWSMIDDSMIFLIETVSVGLH